MTLDKQPMTQALKNRARLPPDGNLGYAGISRATDGEIDPE